MIDYFLKFNTEAEAITAAEGTVLGQYDGNSPPGWQWNTHFVLPNVQAWRISQQDSPPNSPPTPHYLTGWFCLVSTERPNGELNNHPNLQFALNREGPPYVRINKIGAVLQDVAVQPIFAGSHYPIGGIDSNPGSPP